MKCSTIILAISLIFISCDKYNEDVFEIAGIYQASIVGENSSFNMPISIDFGDNIAIEAPFDGIVWDIAYADVDCADCEIKQINIEEQQLEDGVFISGFGAYSYGSIQLDYTMYIFNEEFQFTLIGTK